MTSLHLRTAVAVLLAMCAATVTRNIRPRPTQPTGDQQCVCDRRTIAATPPRTTLATYGDSTITQADLEAWVVGTFPSVIASAGR